MDNNDVFRNILHITGLSCKKELLLHIFKLGGADLISPSKIKGWRTSLNTEEWERSFNRASPMPDKMLNCFFQGLFKYRDLKNDLGIQVFNFNGDV